MRLQEHLPDKQMEQRSPEEQAEQDMAELARAGPCSQRYG